MENKVIDFSKLVPNLSRFSFKAKSVYGYWLYARLDHDFDGQWTLFWKCPEENMNKEVDSDTLCQCTGLKDSNGKLIYENDIIHRLDEVNKRNYLIQYNPNSFHFQVKGEGETEWYDFSFIKLWMDHGVKCVVVGNKFDEETSK